MIYLGLGSNLGNRKRNLAKAIKSLQKKGFELSEISPLVETPALLSENAKPEWNKPYLNCVISGNADWSPTQGLVFAKEIEAQLGRQLSERWSPRPIDIDLLIWHEQIVEQDDLTIPHRGIADRSFVITPLMHLQPDLNIPGLNNTVFQLSQTVRPVPLWMGIINLTPDSFSDGGCWGNADDLRAQLNRFDAHDVQIIDLGAESTRPNATPVAHEAEWNRLEPVFELIKQQFDHHILKPSISIDSRNWRTLEKALNYGANIINDVTGLTDSNIIDIVKQNHCQAIAMHSLTVPVDPKVKLSIEEPAINQIGRWLEQKMEQWQRAGLTLDQIIFDPGIGFGPNPLQAQELLAQCQQLRQFGLRVLIGHSRKSFMASFSNSPSKSRDLETLGISMSLCDQGVDIIRVHDPISHIRSFRAWSQIEHSRALISKS